MSLLCSMPSPKLAALKAASDPQGTLVDIRIAAKDIRSRMKAGEASDTDVFCAINAIIIMTGAL